MDIIWGSLLILTIFMGYFLKNQLLKFTSQLSLNIMGKVFYDDFFRFC